MDGWFNIFPHTITQLTRARGSHKGNCLRRQVGRTLTGGWGGGRAESTTMRCDANETCWGNTVLCILRCAFWNRNRFIHILDFLFLFFSAGFSFSCLECLFVPIRAKSKKSENKHHMHSSSSLSSSYRKGVGVGRRGLGATCAYFWSSGGNIGDFFPPLCEPVSFIPALLLCFYTYDT